MKRIMRIVRFVLIIALLFVITAVSAAGIFIGLSVADGMTHLTTNEETPLRREEQMKSWLSDPQDFLNTYRVEQISILSSLDQHTIPADYISPAGADKNQDTVILVHGLGGTRMSVYGVAEMFLEMGYSVLAYDQRSSGENTAEYNTFGYLESYDLLDCAAYVDSFLDEDKTLAAWGTSFGGATVGIALGRDAGKMIDYGILDCPVSEAKYMIDAELQQISEELSIPLPFLAFTGNLALRAKLGFSVEDMNAVEWIKNAAVPVLVINSENDEMTPAFMGEDLYRAVPSREKRMMTVQDSGHAEVFADYYDTYRETVKVFLGSS